MEEPRFKSPRPRHFPSPNGGKGGQWGRGPAKEKAPIRPTIHNSHFNFAKSHNLGFQKNTLCFCHSSQTPLHVSTKCNQLKNFQIEPSTNSISITFTFNLHLYNLFLWSGLSLRSGSLIWGCNNFNIIFFFLSSLFYSLFHSMLSKLT